MKRILLSLIFVASCAHADAGTSNDTTLKMTATASQVAEAPDWLADMLKKAPAAPVVVCQSINGSDKCVPKYRLSDEINEQSTGRAIKWIEAANAAGADELLLELNTPGGSVDDGFELARAIEESEAPVTCVVDGDAASMGAYILESCGQRYMTRRSKIMFHEPSLSGNMRGTPNQWQAITDMLKATREAIAEHCVSRLKVTMAEYRNKTEGGKMWFLNWREAGAVAAVDGIVESVKKLHGKMLKP
jgi:ATP-dependent protease ClpP protease subunit